MAEIIQFVQNYDDLSTDRGYQFKFYCDHCHNGYMSAFEASKLGMASELLNAAASLFGGALSQAASGAYHVQRAVGGKAHDDALHKAVEEVKGRFKQCTRCGKWVCPEVCWNEARNLCEGCAPDLAQETAAAQAQAQRDQVFEKARATDLVGQVDMKVEAAASCPSCGARTAGSKFCPECGKPINAKAKCGKCGTEMSASSKFCPECGEPHRKSS
ncbi:MAG: zinc ribbon domain-containing protein [Myxococcota bacterium]